ncbi:MAG: ATP-dependent helicase [Firmicutes bacterium]|nr:ATP-dependent helicase [Bacillota bacterium]
MKNLPMLDMNDLNEAQRRAVAWEEGPLLLLAGPGSGKTFTITKRILYLLERGVPPEEILVITFTKDAAAAMQSRFRQLSHGFFPVHFGTFHSVFYHILLESGGTRNLQLLNDSQRKKIMLSILKRLQTNSDLSEESVKILAAVSLYKNTADRERAVSEMPTGWGERFGEIFTSYTEAVREAGAVDFDDMLYECRRLLEGDPGIRRSWQERFRHILIDEFQDCNPMQYEIIRLLAGKPCNLFAVGDDDQSIYGFRGARPDILRRFEKDFRAKRLLLDVNYRCTAEIVNASLAVIRENQDRFPKALRAAESVEGAGRTGGLHIIPFQDREAQTGWLLQQTAEWRQNHEKGGERCAVLFRTNSCMQRMAAAMHGAGIPFFMRERGKNIYEHFVVKDIMAYLLLAEGVWRREHLLRIINRPVRYISREAVGEGRTIPEMQAYYRERPDRESGMPETDRRGYTAGFGAAPGERKSAAAGRAAGHRWEMLERLSCLQRQMDSLRNMPLPLGIRYILKAVGYEGYLRTLAKGNQEKLSEWQETVEWLKEDAKRFRNVCDWAEAQEFYVEEGERSPIHSDNGEPLCLMTVHGAKGLEFERVIIPDCNERIFPRGELQTREQIEEERRIFYVAMTRAKKSLELLYLTGDSRRPRLPSRFLNPLRSSRQPSSPSSSISSSNSQLSRYSSKASATASYSSSSSI